MGVFQNNLMGAAAAAASAGGGDFYSHQIANSLRFPSTTGSSLTNSNLSAGNRKTFTFSVWVKKNWLNKTKIIDINNFMLLKKNTNLRDINTLNDLKFVRKIFNKKNEIL